MIRTPLTKRQIRIHVVLQLFLATWCLWVANAWAFRHSWRVDLTSDQRYALAPETVAFLRQLPTKVDVVVPTSFGRSATDRLRAKIFSRAVRTLEEFELVNPYCRLSETLNIAANPVRWGELRNQLGIDRENRVYFLAGDRREWVSIEDLATITETSDGPILVEERVPEALAAALERLLQEESPRWLFTQGHGAVSPTDTRPNFGVSSWLRDLTERGLILESSDLRRGGAIPEETDVVCITGGQVAEVPFEPFGIEARGEIERFLARGGNLMVFLPFDGPIGFEDLLKEWGVIPLAGLVHSEQANASGAIGAIEAADFDDSHPITARFKNETDRIELASIRGLEVQAPARPLLFSTSQTWLERDLDGRQSAEEPPGPFPVVAATELSRGDVTNRIVVLGSWTPVVDAYHRGQSRRLLLSIADWLLEREARGVGTGRVDAGHRVPWSPDHARLWNWITLLIAPGLVLLIGGAVVWMRRRA